MGAQQILDAILHDANADAEIIINNAKATANETITAAVVDANAVVADIASKALQEASETQKRRLLTAGIDARKNTLAKKRELMSTVFEQAKAQLCKLDSEAYQMLITKLVVGGSQTGEEQILAPAEDFERYAKPFSNGKTMVEILNIALVESGKKGKLSLCSETGSFCGGVKLIGTETDIDCSFGALVNAYKDEHEAEVSTQLFKTEV